MDTTKENALNKLKLARNISYMCVAVILFHSYKTGISYWTLFFLISFAIYSIYICKPNKITPSLGLLLSILFSISYINASGDLASYIFIIIINYGFINGLIGAYILSKNKTI